MTEAVVERIETRLVSQRVPIAVLVAVLLLAPWAVYPVFAMKAVCFALFACAFNLLIGYVGLLSFGHALFFGGASYASAYAALAWNWPPELAILFSTAVAAGLGMLFIGARLQSERTVARARHVLLASVVYLPALLAVMVLDRRAF